MRTRWGVAAAALLTTLTVSVPADAQLVDVPPLPDVPDLPDVPVVPDLPAVPPAPLPGAADGGGDGAGEGGATGAGSTAPGRGSEPAGSGTQRAGRAQGERTRFDRLPRRYERLLERIMRGRDLDANLRRLERALASASPALRARILRLVRREIASLRRGDVTARDRRTIRRLERVEALLSPGAAGAQGEGDLASATPLAAAGAAPDPGSGGAATGTASSVAPAPARREPTPEPPSVRPLLGVPFPGEIAFGALVLILFLAFLGVAALAFALAATPSAAVPAGRARRLLTTSRSNLAVTGLLALAATMLVLVVGVLL